MNPSANNAYLYAAYVVVWVVHCVYAFSLASRARRMKREAGELAASARKGVSGGPY
jgi:CcmD family protein